MVRAGRAALGLIWHSFWVNFGNPLRLGMSVWDTHTHAHARTHTHTHAHANRPATVVLMSLPTTTIPTPTSITTATTTSGIAKTQQPASLAGSLGLAVTAAHVCAY